MKRLLFLALLTITLVVTAWASLDDIRVPLGNAPELASPQDHISQDQIQVFEDRVVINIKNAKWARFTDTNSMDPLFDEGANSLEIQPENPQSIHVGDIISYYYKDSIIVHRVVGIDTDDEGIFYTVQGDNNDSADPLKVRFEQVHGIVVGILY